MGATLRYAKVVDREGFQRSGARVRPGLDSWIELTGDAGYQLVLDADGNEVARVNFPVVEGGSA